MEDSPDGLKDLTRANRLIAGRDLSNTFGLSMIFRSSLDQYLE